MDQLFSLATADKVSAVAVVIIVCTLVITDKLGWHTRWERAEARADRWEKVALEALTAGAQAGVKAAEVAVGVVSALPDPKQDHSDRKV